MDPKQINEILLQAKRSLNERGSNVVSIFETIDKAISHLPYYNQDAYFRGEWNKLKETIDRDVREGRKDLISYLDSLLSSNDIGIKNYL